MTRETNLRHRNIRDGIVQTMMRSLSNQTYRIPPFVPYSNRIHVCRITPRRLGARTGICRHRGLRIPGASAGYPTKRHGMCRPWPHIPCRIHVENHGIDMIVIDPPASVVQPSESLRVALVHLEVRGEDRQHHCDHVCDHAVDSAHQISHVLRILVERGD